MGFASTNKGGNKGKPFEDQLADSLPTLEAYVRKEMGHALKAKESASDLVQSTCREVIRNKSFLSGRDDKFFRYWLRQTALRKILNHANYWKRSKRDRTKEASASQIFPEKNAVSEITPSQEMMGKERMDQITAAFAKLPDNMRQVIIMAKLQGIERAEIARRLGRNIPAVNTLLCRAMVRFSEIFEQNNQG